ncbi:protein argonaute 16-like protein [Carex littledalei]|uniref:Protein argonaute 16-like protein n=1 Tax=Carex littledalei TaxID=544730 RepID=A0A833QUI9_9POAL|nr:protein argonaute 16-like protein [Carex littledalei]
MDQKLERVIMTRPGVGKEGRSINLLSNHFHVRFTGTDIVFYNYYVSMKYDNDILVENKKTSRKVIEKMCQMYSSELSGRDYIYDGEMNLFSVGSLPQTFFEFTVVLEETSARVPFLSRVAGNYSEGENKRMKRIQKTTLFKVALTYASKIPLSSIAVVHKGGESPHVQSAIMVLNVMLRQQQARMGCLVVRQSFFNGDPKNLTDLEGGVTACRGFHSSFNTTSGGLSFNMDVAMTVILTPGPVIDFILANQIVKEPRQIDWVKAKRMLKNLRIKTKHSRKERRIFGLSELPCNQQSFTMKVRDDDGEYHTVETTVSDYFRKKYQLDLTWSSSYPCLDLGKPRNPTYVPLEMCDLIPLQRYTKALSSKQRASLLDKTRHKPQERSRIITEAVRSNGYDEDPLLAASGIQIEKQMTRLTGRVLPAPRLILGNGVGCVPDRGRWNIKDKILQDPVKIGVWAVVNFSTRVDMSYVSRQLINYGRCKGIHIDQPQALIMEQSRYIERGPVVRVDKMFERLRYELRDRPKFILCILSEKNDLYGPLKKKCLQEEGITSQCMCPGKHTELYFGNLLLKINAKLGGINSVLALEDKRSMPLVQKKATLILGLDVWHGSAGRYNSPSIAAVVGSRCWPSISKYRASVRTQVPKIEMIDSLCIPKPNGYDDDGIIREMLLDFYQSSNGQKPEQIIMFRDGVSQSQFNKVLNIEVSQIMKVCNYIICRPLPKVTVIIAQKKHHTKLFQADSPQNNVPPGTVVDTRIVHPRHYDFYMCAHNGIIGTSRPAHYHVLIDEIGFAVDELQQFIHNLSYVYAMHLTITESININSQLVIAPIAYAHHAAEQVSKFLIDEYSSDTSSDSDAVAPVPELQHLHPAIWNSMFFC